MPKRKRLWKHQVPVVELLSFINIHYVHSNKDFSFLAGCYCLPLNFRSLFFQRVPFVVLVHSGVCLAPFVERCPAGFPRASRASGQQPSPQLPEPSGASKHQGIHSHLRVTQMAQSSPWQVVCMRSDCHLHLLGRVNGK